VVLEKCRCSSEVKVMGTSIKAECKNRIKEELIKTQEGKRRGSRSRIWTLRLRY
jgi:hypothetical protein